MDGMNYIIIMICELKHKKNIENLNPQIVLDHDWSSITNYSMN